MRVVSWNVWWRFGGNWRDREGAILATLSELRPDIVGLQESWVGRREDTQAALLARALSMNHAVGAPSLPPPPDVPETPDQAEYQVGVALLSRWPILRADVHRLPARHREPPVALVGRLDHPDGPLHAVVSCIEWEPAYADDQLAQARALAELIRRLGDPVLLMADLNAPPESEVLRILRGAMRDTWALAGAPEAPTLSSANPFAPREAVHLLDRRIDYVLVRSGDAVEAAFRAGDPVDGVHPSDHHAVVADLSR